MHSLHEALWVASVYKKKVIYKYSPFTIQCKTKWRRGQRDGYIQMRCFDLAQCLSDGSGAHRSLAGYSTVRSENTWAWHFKRLSTSASPHTAVSPYAYQATAFGPSVLWVIDYSLVA